MFGPTNSAFPLFLDENVGADSLSFLVKARTHSSQQYRHVDGALANEMIRLRNKNAFLGRRTWQCQRGVCIWLAGRGLDVVRLRHLLMPAEPNEEACGVSKGEGSLFARGRVAG